MNRDKEFLEKAIQVNRETVADMLNAQKEERFEEYQEGILCIDKEEVYTVTLGTGGPAYGFKIYVENKKARAASAWYQDWGTQKEEYFLSPDELEALLSMVYIEGVSE